ncbi:MAG: hypothetical protein CM15mP78_06850 [Candidatus Poseidoniales archaeon]|nr:MAG: hypothetical protein CM15mP78_06850 [Candidatus Poseidoniales archaeon]
MNTVDQLKQAARRLSAACDEAIAGLEASGAVAHATNPLDYAWAHHEQFLDLWGGLGATTLLLGMNPGPWGMAQTGVPFGATQVAKFSPHRRRPLSTRRTPIPSDPSLEWTSSDRKSQARGCGTSWKKCTARPRRPLRTCSS